MNPKTCSKQSRTRQLCPLSPRCQCHDWVRGLSCLLFLLINQICPAACCSTKLRAYISFHPFCVYFSEFAEESGTKSIRMSGITAVGYTGISKVRNRFGGTRSSLPRRSRTHTTRTVPSPACRRRSRDRCCGRSSHGPVSYTHLTLPTKA